MTETIVMKFGGSSVADPDKVRLVAKRFVEALAPVPDPSLRSGIPVPPGLAPYRRPGLVG